MTFISVIIITKNNAETLEACTNSLLKQTFPKESFEVIFVDGHSLDGTIEIVENYKSSRINTKILYEDYGKMGYARNVGLTEAKGDIIAFTDGDAVLPEVWLQKIAESFADEKTLIVGGLDVLLSNKESNKIIDSWNRLEKASGMKAIPRIRTVNFAIRREPLLKMGGFDSELSHFDETELMARLQHKMNASSIEYNPDIVVYHRQAIDTTGKRMKKIFRSTVAGVPVLLRKSMLKVVLANPTSAIGISFFLIPCSLLLACAAIFSVIEDAFLPVLILGLIAYFAMLSSYVITLFSRTRTITLQVPLIITLDFLVRTLGSFLGSIKWFLQIIKRKLQHL